MFYTHSSDLYSKKKSICVHWIEIRIGKFGGWWRRAWLERKICSPAYLKALKCLKNELLLSISATYPIPIDIFERVEMEMKGNTILNIFTQNSQKMFGIVLVDVTEFSLHSQRFFFFFSFSYSLFRTFLLIHRAKKSVKNFSAGKFKQYEEKKVKLCKIFFIPIQNKLYMNNIFLLGHETWRFHIIKSNHFENLSKSWCGCDCARLLVQNFSRENKKKTTKIVWICDEYSNLISNEYGYSLLI